MYQEPASENILCGQLALTQPGESNGIGFELFKILK